jgi:hypothetical protein
MQRIEAFLREEEVPDWASSLKEKDAKRKKASLVTKTLL